VWRAAWLVAVVLVFVMARSCLGGPRYVIQIQFGIDPEFLAGAQVVIDDVVVGHIERRGARTVNGFRVEEGEHTVAVRKEGCNWEPAHVTTGFGGTTVVLMATPDAEMRGAESVCVIRLD
jgi:hypothetical protein